jgi:hypothetical protein
MRRRSFLWALTENDGLNLELLFGEQRSFEDFEEALRLLRLLRAVLQDRLC